MQDLPKSYDASQVEDAIYQKWMDGGYFNPDNLLEAKAKKPYTIILPPLNVTGNLHMGHAFEDTIQDVLIRFHRMLGQKTLWLPGTDHAAIATQAKVESELIKKENKNRHDLGREEFLNRVNEFAQNSHDTIVSQLKKMGASVDWSREAYTLDSPRSRAVKSAFKRLYDLGVIYRGLRIVNWDPKGQTTISDDEIVRENRPGKLYTFKYAADFPIAISTSRPETKVGDTAVAVHPEDARYQEFIGREYDVVFCGSKLHIRIVSDESIDPEFGTGALGVTPAHSQIDWEIAEKNNLPHKQVIDERGRMMIDNENLHGKKIFEAREFVAEWLREQGLMEKEEDIVQAMALSERTKGIVEPLPKEQWFIDVNREFAIPHSEIAGIESGEIVTLKRLMRHVVETGQVKIVPGHFEKIYFHWIDNLRDWCISRQLWFGHRIPAWFDSEGKTHVVKEKKIYLTRHAECEDNARNLMVRPDSPLTELGIDQSASLARELADKNITKIIASPLIRSLDTAKIVLQELGLSEPSLEIWEELAEVHVGDLIGREEKPDIDGFAEAQKLGTGESLESLEKRTKELVKRLEKSETPGSILLVGHGAINAIIEAVLLGRDKEEFVHFRAIRGNIPNIFCQEILLAQDPLGEGLEQDEDTFDTWFSSGLWTFATLGWPNEARDMKEFHPTTVINPGYEILQLWVARMILMSTVLTGQVPFKTAFIHGLVRDKEGRKFSKSLNNGIDPQDMIAKYGTDALRMALIFSGSPSSDVAFDEQKVKGMKHFANKLWNIARFIITNISLSVIPTFAKASAGKPVSTSESASAGDPESMPLQNGSPGSPQSRSPEDDKVVPDAQYSHLWGRPETLTDADTNILSKLDALVTETTEHLENFRLHEAAQSIYQFTWHELADVYIEAAKHQLNNPATKQSTEKMLFHCLITILKLLHPFMPFVTEHIAGIMTERGLRKYHDPLIISKWPKIS